MMSNLFRDGATAKTKRHWPYPVNARRALRATGAEEIAEKLFPRPDMKIRIRWRLYAMPGELTANSPLYFK